MIKQGHVLDVLAGLPDNHFHTVVTSPPYWSLRKYDIPDVTWPDAWRGQLGLEPTIDLFLTHLLSVFREVKRVLRPDGTCWVNIGDSYSSGSDNPFPKHVSDNVGVPRRVKELAPKNLCLIPFRFALAMQADGWWVRQDIIWAKRNPMPESVVDRCTKAHEYIFLFTKSAKYFYDAEAVREAHKEPERGKGEKEKNNFSYGEDRGAKPFVRLYNPSGRNLRSVWEINTQPYPEAHFATFPEELPRRCILAGTSARGCCPECGKPWERVVERGGPGHTGKTDCTYPKGTTANRLASLRQASREAGGEYQSDTKTLSWRPTCECGKDPVPCRVLDPFIGSGTTGKVAESLGREWVGIDLGYNELGMKRVQGQTRGMAI